MRAAPALQLTIERFAVWRSAIALLVAAAAASVAAWLGVEGLLPAAIAAAAGLASLPATRRPGSTLAFDGAQWRLGPAGTDLDAMSSGVPRVMIDLGGFLLLRFDGEAGIAWLPLQRSGLDGVAWHALRCALYSPPPRAPSAPPDDVSPPA